MYKRSILTILLTLVMIVSPVYAGNGFNIDEGKASPAKTVSNIGAVALPLAAVATVAIKHDGKGVWQGALVAGSTFAATQLIKYVTQVPRPDGSDNLSFPSGHTSLSFSMATFMQRRYGAKIGLPALGVATTVGVCRVLAKRHSVTDVVAGAMLGVAAGYIITTPYAAKHELSVSPYASPESYGMAASFTF